MKIAFVVNDVQTELATYTTTRLAMAAANMGHQSLHVRRRRLLVRDGWLDSCPRTYAAGEEL